MLHSFHLIPAIVCLLLLSCSSKVAVSATANEIDNILQQDKSEIPVFKDSIVSDYVQEYDKFVTEYFGAIKKQDEKKIKQLQKQSEELVEKAIIISEKLKTPAQFSRYKDWMRKQQKKIQLLNNIK